MSVQVSVPLVRFIRNSPRCSRFRLSCSARTVRCDHRRTAQASRWQPDATWWSATQLVQPAACLFVQARIVQRAGGLVGQQRQDAQLVIGVNVCGVRKATVTTPSRWSARRSGNPAMACSPQLRSADDAYNGSFGASLMINGSLP